MSCFWAENFVRWMSLNYEFSVEWLWVRLNPSLKSTIFIRQFTKYPIKISIIQERRKGIWSEASDLGVVEAYARSSLLAHELTTTSANDGHCGSGYCGRLHAFEFTWAWRMNLIHQKSVNFKCFHFINRFNSPKEEFRIFLPFKPFLVPRLGLLAFVHPTVNLRIRS